MTTNDAAEKEAVRNRLHFGAVGLITYLFLIVGSFALVAHQTAGPGYGFLANAAIGAVFLATVSPCFGPALAIWLGVIWIISIKGRLWRSRTWMAMAPPLFFLVYRVGILVADPPSPQKYFHETFAVSLPADARAVEVAHPTLADPGFVDFAFTCSEESVDDLIVKMDLDPVTHESRAPFLYFRVGSQWNWHEWTTPYQFAKTLRTGTGHILVADADKARVMVARYPLFGKSEAKFSQGTNQE
ncbi:MAG: hypothetical protein JNK37_25145 [Verrucomicrobiales bacterium]|nr:hypothetical protein [Verrucomicrobiales bacterium]